MIKLLLLVILTAIVHSCPQNYQPWFDGRCFNREGFPEDCQNGLHRPDIKAQEESELFHDNVAGYFVPNDHSWKVWIGLTCDGQKFVWSDGTEATYTNFAEEQTCDSSKTGHKYFIHYDGKWYEEFRTDVENFQITTVCEADHRTDSPCDALELDETIDTCYELQKWTSSWTYADDDCRSHMDAHLPIIHYKQMNDFIRRTAMSSGIVDGVHIGLRKDSTGKFTWIDGSSIDYMNFAPGYPNATGGDCVVMQTESTAGQWINVDCNTHYYRYICTRTPFYPTNPQPVAANGCPGQSEYGPGDEIFSPSFPLPPGVNYCDYFLLQPNSTKKAGIEITFLESNTCCDKLTIYEGIFGTSEIKHIQGYHSETITGWAKSNTMRLRWNSTDGAHIRGFRARMIE